MGRLVDACARPRVRLARDGVLKLLRGGSTVVLTLKRAQTLYCCVAHAWDILGYGMKEVMNLWRATKLTMGPRTSQAVGNKQPTLEQQFKA